MGSCVSVSLLLLNPRSVISATCSSFPSTPSGANGARLHMSSHKSDPIAHQSTANEWPAPLT